MNVKKCLKILSITLLSLFVIYLIYAFTLEERVWMSIEIENYIPIFAKMDKKDTHGGMLNEDRHSYNFTVAVFDTDAKILYIYELDT